MIKKEMFFSLFFFLFLLLFPIAFAQETSSSDSSSSKTTTIQILFPQNDVTYGPWSDTYFDYPKTGGKAHHIRISVAVGDDVSYYRIMRNNEWVQYVGNVTMNDAVPDDAIIDFKPEDTEPMDLVGYLSALQNLTIIAFDENHHELGRDSVVFYLAVNLDDYYELLESGEAIQTELTLEPDIGEKIEVTQENIEQSLSLFTVVQTVTEVQVKNRFTGETETHSRVTVSIEPTGAGMIGQSADVYAIIPKDIVASLSNLTLTGDFVVIDADPVMMWHFAAVEESQEVEYDVHVPVNTEDAKEIVPIAIAETVGTRTSWYFLIPLVIPVILLFAIVYFSRFKKK